MIDNTIQEMNCVPISVGYFHSIALKKDGTPVSWGCNATKQITDTPKGSNCCRLLAFYCSQRRWNHCFMGRKWK